MANVIDLNLKQRALSLNLPEFHSMSWMHLCLERLATQIWYVKEQRSELLVGEWT